MKPSKNTNDEKKDAQTYTQTNPKSYSQINQKQKHQPVKKTNMFQRATNLLDGITQNFIEQLSNGKLFIDSNRKRVQQIEQSLNISPNARHKTISFQTQQIDLQQHKKKIKKFINQNKTLRRNIEMRSIQIMQLIKNQQQTQKQKIKQQKMKTLQLRRTQISKRLTQRQVRLRQIKRHSVTQGQNHSSLRKKKLFYQLKQQQYLHKLQNKKQQDQKIINRQKQKMKPMNINDILQHQKSYDKKIKDQRVTRNLNHQKLQKQWESYHPPNFVPKAYLLAAEQEKKQKQVQQKKLKLWRANQIKKKKFLQALQQIKHAQYQFSLSKSKSPKASQRKNLQTPEKIEINPAQKKQKGNNYLREVLSKLKKPKVKQNIPAYDQGLLYRKKKIKSEYQLEIVRQQRIQQVQKIRYRRIDEILKSEDSQIEKLQRLQYEAKKFDDFAKQKFKSASKRKNEDMQNIMDRNQGASFMMGSIHAKLAILTMGQKQNQAKIRVKTTN